MNSAEQEGRILLAMPALETSIGQGWGNTVLALIAAAFIPPLGLLMRYGDWLHSKERFGNAGR
jgi:hypothetical protein